MWLGGIKCAWLARLFGTTPNEEGFKERKMCMESLSVSVCPCLIETVCLYLLYGHMLLHCSDMLSCPNLRLKTASSLSWDAAHQFFLPLFITVVLYLSILPTPNSNITRVIWRNQASPHLYWSWWKAFLLHLLLSLFGVPAAHHEASNCIIVMNL